MSATYLPQRQRYRITLELDVMDDFNPHNIDWEKVLDVQGNESIDAYVEDFQAHQEYNLDLLAELRETYDSHKNRYT